VSFLPRDSYAKRGICHCVSVCVCVSVTLQYCIKTAKRRIMQIMPHDRSATLVYTDKRVSWSLCHSRATCLITNDILYLFQTSKFQVLVKLYSILTTATDAVSKFLLTYLKLATSTMTSVIQSMTCPTTQSWSLESIHEHCHQRQPNWRCTSDIC